jgi:hypothetical protein
MVSKKNPATFFVSVLVEKPEFMSESRITQIKGFRGWSKKSGNIPCQCIDNVTSIHRVKIREIL